MHTYYNDYFKKTQQRFDIYLYERRIPDDDPVYTLKKVLEDMSFEKLLQRYSPKGRQGYNPIMIYAVLLYANMRGIRSVDQIVESCQRDIAFIWLAEGAQPKRDVFYSFINEKLTLDILEDLHYQFIRKLQKEDYLTLKTLFLDGTKIEANANRYTFVWRGSINYHLIKLLDKVRDLFSDFNDFISEKDYSRKYGLSSKEMFIVESEDKVRKTIEENRIRKRNKKKKISNNKILEIDHVSPIDMMKTAIILSDIARDEDITFKHQKGCKKSELQKIYERFEDCANRLMKYKDCFETMGTGRNSYSKTDIEATFMRMKEDHMLNGQLKPAYNIQFGVENYFIVHTYVSNDRTDYNTMIPVIEKHSEYLKDFKLAEFTADSGYCSERNLLYLKENEIQSFIKLQEHEKKKTRKYHQNIGKYYNMKMTECTNPDGTLSKSYICHAGRRLNHVRTETQRKDGFSRTFEIYASESCEGCEHKAGCLYKYDPEKEFYKNKLMKVNEQWDDLKHWSEENVLSEKGIRYRQIRSVMTEGSFGDMKENDNFRRFHRRGKEKVLKELLLYVFARNMNKYCRFEMKTLSTYNGNAA